MLKLDDEDGVHGDFQTRRSGRQHFKPLKWWKGEKFEYKKGPQLAVIKEVVHVPDDYVEPLSYCDTLEQNLMSTELRLH